MAAWVAEAAVWNGPRWPEQGQGIIDAALACGADRDSFPREMHLCRVRGALFLCGSAVGVLRGEWRGWLGTRVG